MILPVPAGSEYEPQQIWPPSSEAILGWDLDFHELMLHDHIRMTAFREAIRETVRPGMSVLDLGTGTGILALWALEAGAARVYGIDMNEALLRAAADRIAEAGHRDAFTPMRGLSFDVALPERVDLIISEIIGNLVDNEDCVTILNDARERFLKPAGQLLPRRVESYLVPVAAGKAHDQVAARGVADPFDLYYDTILPRDTCLASPRLLRLHQPEQDMDPDYRLHLPFAVGRAGMFTGFKGYFVATLSDTVALDIGDDDIAARTTSDSWKHCYLPVEQPVEVRPHDRISLEFSRTGVSDRRFRQSYQWSGRILRDGALIGAFDHRTGSAKS